MKRRNFLKMAGLGLAIPATLAPGVSSASPPISLKMAVIPPLLENRACFFPNIFLETVENLSGGKLRIIPHTIQEKNIPKDPASLITRGQSDMVFGQLNRHPDAPAVYHFFSGIPFGMTGNETLAWIKQGGGERLLQDLFVPQKIRAFLVGLCGVKPSGWYQFTVNQVSDFKNKNIGISGLASDIITTLGGIPKPLTSTLDIAKLSDGQMDGIAGTCPAADMDLGLPWSGATLYWPGWHTTSTMTTLLASDSKLSQLPESLQQIIAWASYASTSKSIATYTYQNTLALASLMKHPNIKIRQMPDQVTAVIAKLCQEKVRALSKSSPEALTVSKAYAHFFKQVLGWTQVSDEAFSLARSLTQAYL